MEVELPGQYQLVYGAAAIRARVGELAAEIAQWARAAEERTGKQVLAVCILRGAVPFFSDLTRALPHSVEPAFCRTWSYSSTTNMQSGQGVRLAVQDVVAEGRAILMIDDICDTGATLLKLHNVFFDLGASEVKSAVLIQRNYSAVKYVPNWSAFCFAGKEWFVGYGMEDKNHFANLPEVYQIVPA